MPRYSYKCTKCGHKFDEICMIKFRNDAKVCPSCNGPAGRDAETEINTRPSTQNEDHLRWSWSMGATPQVAREMLKKHPDFQYKYGENGGPLLVKNRQDKLRKMKIHGMQEY